MSQRHATIHPMTAACGQRGWRQGEWLIHCAFILLLILLLLLLGGLPRWPHSKNWGYGPSGFLGLVLVVVLVLVLLGYIPRGF